MDTPRLPSVLFLVFVIGSLFHLFRANTPTPIRIIEGYRMGIAIFWIPIVGFLVLGSMEGTLTAELVLRAVLTGVSISLVFYLLYKQATKQS